MREEKGEGGPTFVDEEEGMGSIRFGSFLPHGSVLPVMRLVSARTLGTRSTRSSLLCPSGQ